MNILLIWDGISWDHQPKPLTDLAKQYYKRIREVYPDATITWITKDPRSVVQGDEYENYYEYTTKAWDKYKYECSQDGLNPMYSKEQPEWDTDFFRYMYLSEHPYTLYLDTDMYLLERIPETDRMMRWAGDVCAFWNGNETDVFQWLLDNRSFTPVHDMHKNFPRLSKFLNEYMVHKKLHPPINLSKCIIK